jgi:hypothetical protein
MNQRGATRQRTYKGGRINFETAGLDCIIRNLSDKGACLEVESPTPVPDNFRLIIMPESLVRTCEVAWRKPRKIGVRFV